MTHFEDMEPDVWEAEDTESRTREYGEAICCSEESEADAEDAGVESCCQLLMQDLRSFPLLTREQEMELTRAAATGDAEARERLINCNMRLVVAAARDKMAQSTGLPISTSLEDLIQAGAMGLITAVDKYDPEKKAKFGTYATYWINEAIRSALSHDSRLIRIPDHKVDLMVAVKKAENTLQAILGRAAKKEELFLYFDKQISMTNLKDALALIYNTGTVSLDAPAGDDEEDGTIGSMFSSPEDETPAELYYREQRNVAIADAIAALSEKEQIVIRMAFGLDGEEEQTLDTIAEVLYQKGFRNRQGKKMSKVAVFQIKDGALAKMKAALADAI